MLELVALKLDGRKRNLLGFTDIPSKENHPALAQSGLVAGSVVNALRPLALLAVVAAVSQYMPEQ